MKGEKIVTVPTKALSAILGGLQNAFIGNDALDNFSVGVQKCLTNSADVKCLCGTACGGYTP